MAFIKLTLLDGAAVWPNSAYIASLLPHDGRTRVFEAGASGDGYWTVTETPEQILAAIAEAAPVATTDEMVQAAADEAIKQSYLVEGEPVPDDPWEGMSPDHRAKMAAVIRRIVEAALGARRQP